MRLNVVEHDRKSIVYDKRKIWKKEIGAYFMTSFQHSAEENWQDGQKTGLE
jgi:hypothetical protein